MTSHVRLAPHDPSGYVIYVDESGDHSLTKIDKAYPMFVLAFCILQHADIAKLCNDLAAFKLKYFGHDAVVMHERDIRKSIGPFRILLDAQVRDAFMADLSLIVERTSFSIVAIAIRKEDHIRRYSYPASPYELGVQFGLERVASFLAERGVGDKTTHFVFEARGDKEDTELELDFRRVCDNASTSDPAMPFELHFAAKSAPICGLQLADLIARPIGRHVLNPSEPNRAFDTIRPKFRRGPIGQIERYGLKVFP